MKKIALACLLCCITNFALAQHQDKSTKKDKTSTEKKEKVVWKELDEYHTVMSQTFHPAEEGNLQPVLTRSKELAEKASVLAKSTVPDAYKKKNLQTTLQQLETESAALHKMVIDKKTNEEIKKAIFALHDRFHEIMEKCHH